MSWKSRIASDKLEETGRELQWLICILCLKCMKELRKTIKDLKITNLPLNIIFSIIQIQVTILGIKL